MTNLKILIETHERNIKKSIGNKELEEYEGKWEWKRRKDEENKTNIYDLELENKILARIVPLNQKIKNVKYLGVKVEYFHPNKKSAFCSFWTYDLSNNPELKDGIPKSLDYRKCDNLNKNELRIIVDRLLLPKILPVLTRKDLDFYNSLEEE